MAEGNVLIVSGVNLAAQDICKISQGDPPFDGGPEIGTGGLYLCQLDLARRELALGCLARGLALTIKLPVLYCMDE